VKTNDMKNILKFKISKDSIDIKNIFSKCQSFWFKRYKIILLLLFSISISFGGYIWYDSIYHSDWDDEKKQQYLISQGSEVNFKEDQFDNIKKFINERKVKYAGNHEEVKEIFRQNEEN